MRWIGLSKMLTKVQRPHPRSVHASFKHISFYLVAKHIVAKTGTNNLSLLLHIPDIKCMMAIDKLSFRIIISNFSQTDKRQQATPLNALD